MCPNGHANVYAEKKGETVEELKKQLAEAEDKIKELQKENVKLHQKIEQMEGKLGGIE